jgi:hypothetical protein
MQYQCQLAIRPTQPSPTQLSLQEAQRRGNPSPNCLCEKRSDVAILHPTVFARSAATWQSSTQLSLREAQRRGNPPPNCLCEKRSDVAIYRYRLDCFTPFAMTGKRAYEKRSNVAILHPTVFARSAATWQSSTQLSLRGAQRRGNLSVSLAEMISLWQCGFFTKEPQRNEATLCLYII